MDLKTRNSQNLKPCIVAGKCRVLGCEVSEKKKKSKKSVVTGSYENSVQIFTLHPKSLTLTPRSSHSSHLSFVTTVAIAGSVVASGSNDEIITLKNLSGRRRKPEFQHHHYATVTALSGDATGAVDDLALHPSGHFALAVGSHECLAMVDLISGSIVDLGKEGSFVKGASLVKFIAAGDRFFTATEEKVSVHMAEDARLLLQLKCPKRVLCAAPARNGLLYTGSENRNITAWDIKSGKIAHCLEEAHSGRVKGVVVMKGSDVATGDDDSNLLASASSDGIIRVWDDRMTAWEKPLAEHNTRSRVTCLAGSCLKFKRPQSGKRERKSKVENQTMEG